MAALNGQHKNMFKSAILLGAVALPMPRTLSLTKPVEGLLFCLSLVVLSAIEAGQAVYDQVVKAAGCKVGPESLECLRKVDFKKLTWVLFCLSNSDLVRSIIIS